MNIVVSLARAAGLPQVSEQSNHSGFIVSPLYDCLFFIGSPLLALAIGFCLVGTPLNASSALLDNEKSLADFGIGVFIFAHLVIVIFRSHLNPKIFKLHPARFTLVPVLLFLVMGLSTWALVFCIVLATFWDVYHSGMQTFGIGRIYDARAGNAWQTGRRLDWILNVLLYAGPIAAGATLMDHVDDFEHFEEVGAVFFTSIPAYAQSNARYLTWGVIGIGVPFLVYYVYAYWRLYRQGYHFSPQKIALLVSTGICSIYAWGFNSFGMAFFIMNFFHALQYFAIVWWAENGNISRVFGFEGQPWAKPAGLGLLLAVGLSYGIFAEASSDENAWLMSLFILISLMHFWYDGFIWSVAKKQV